jgi:hypothetical protein
MPLGNTEDGKRLTKEHLLSVINLAYLFANCILYTQNTHLLAKSTVRTLGRRSLDLSGADPVPTYNPRSQRTFRAVLTRPKPSFPHQHSLYTMADSDEDYIGAISEDEGDDNVVRGSRGAAGSASKRRRQKGGAEFELSRTWETLVEGADGTISSTVEGLLEASKRKR